MMSDGREFLKQLRELADPEDLIVLLAACSGRRVHVPSKRPTATSWIARTIGMDKAIELVRRLNVEARYDVEIDVPFCSHGLYAAVRRLVRERVDAGLREGRHVSVLAAECGITRRAVQYRRRRLQEIGLLSGSSRRSPSKTTHPRSMIATDVKQSLITVSANTNLVTYEVAGSSPHSDTE